MRRLMIVCCFLFASTGAAHASSSKFEIALPAGASFSLVPVSGYVNGWWDNMLADGPTGLLLSAGDEREFLAWLESSGPHAIRLTSRYEIVETDNASHLHVFLDIDGIDERWHAAIEGLVDRFLEHRLFPYIAQLHHRQQATSEMPAP